MAIEGVEFKLWHYNPSLTGAVIAVLVFVALTSFHAFKLWTNRTWFYVPFVVGGLFETTGYAARAAAHNDTKSLTPYIIQSLLILIAPILFAASIYMILGRLIRRTGGDAYSIVRPTWVTRIFVGGDIFCFLLQSTGGGLLAQAKNKNDFDLAEDIILGGLILQIIVFGFFVVIAAVFHRRLRTNPTSESRTMPWQRYMIMLYAVSACITVRNLLRVVDYAQKDGYLMNYEWTLYIYDFLLMAGTLLICTQWYDPDIQLGKRRDDVALGPWI